MSEPRKKEMTAEDFKPKDRVLYVPSHAHGDINHKDVLHGRVSSQNGKNVFVRFDKQVARYGWAAASESCSPWDLVLI